LVNEELLIKLNSFEEKGIKYVWSTILQSKTIGKIEPKCLHITIKSKNKRNNVLLKKSAISQEKQRFWDFFSETKEIALY